MKNLIKNLIAIIILGAVIFWFRVPLKESYLNIREQIFPCRFPLKYSIGTFDEQFGISKDEFLLSIKKAEGIWERAIGKQLFTYEKNGGDLKISLIYDTRQETTNKLKNIGSDLSEGKDSYDSLKSEYDSLYQEYLRDKDNIKNQNDAIAFNQKVDRLNNLSDRINNLAKSVNEQVKKYNNVIAGERGGEFEEGLYFAGKSGRGINIYEFKNNDNLVRVLVHEMGHALYLGHSEDEQGIMYPVNAGTNITLSKTDIEMLKTHCGIK